MFVLKNVLIYPFRALEFLLLDLLNQLGSFGGIPELDIPLVQVCFWSV